MEKTCLSWFLSHYEFTYIDIWVDVWVDVCKHCNFFFYCQGESDFRSTRSKCRIDLCLWLFCWTHKAVVTPNGMLPPNKLENDPLPFLWLHKYTTKVNRIFTEHILYLTGNLVPNRGCQMVRLGNSLFCFVYFLNKCIIYESAISKKTKYLVVKTAAVPMML